MAERTIEIKIIAKDEASKVITGVVGDLKKGFNDLGNLSNKVLKGTLKAGAIAAGAAFASMGAGLAVAVKAAMDAQGILAQLDAVIASTGEAAGITAQEARDLADSLASVTRFSNEAIVGAENILLTFTNIGEDVFPQTLETILDMSQALGQDLKSSAIQLGKALNDPVLGVSALAEVGVNFNQEAKDMIKTMVEEGRILEAQQFILRELRLEFGNSARAAGQTLAGQLDILKNSLVDVAQVFGDILIPFITKFIENINQDIIPALKSFANYIALVVGEGDYLNDFLADLPESVRPLAEMVGKVIEFFRRMIAEGMDFRTALAGLIPEELRQKIDRVWEAFMRFRDDVVRPFIDEWGPEIEGAIKGIGVALLAAGIIKNLGTIVGLILKIVSPMGVLIGLAALLGAAWEGNWGGIQEKTQEVIDYVQPKIEEFLGNVETWWNENKETIMTAVNTAWDAVKTKITEVVEVVRPLVEEFVKGATQWWSDHKDEVYAVATVAYETLRENIETLGQKFSDAKVSAAEFGQDLQDRIPAILDIFSRFRDEVSKIDFEPLITSFKDLKGSLDDTVQSFKDFGEASGIDVDAIDVIDFAIGILAETFEVLAIGVNASAEAIEALNKAAKGVSEWAGGVADILTGLLTGDTSKMQEGGARAAGGQESFWGGLIDTITTVVSGKLDILKSLFTDSNEEIEDEYERLNNKLVGRSIIPDMMDDIVDTISNGVLDMATAVSTNAAKVTTAFKTLMTQIAAVFEQYDWVMVGATIGAQIAAGIQSAAPGMATGLATGMTTPTAPAAGGTITPAPVGGATPGVTSPTVAPAAPAAGQPLQVTVNIGNEQLGTFMTNTINSQIAAV